MTNIKPVSIQTHAQKYWRRQIEFSFAREDVVCPLAGHEMPRALMGLPTGFIKVEDNFHLVALQGLQPRLNLLVGAKGAWQSNYLPERYRHHPFVVADSDTGEKVLCADEESGLITTEPGENREPFYVDDEVNPRLREILNKLVQHSEQLKNTTTNCELLAAHKLIVNWDIKLDRNKPDNLVRGLYCIDEKALNAIDLESLGRLRDSGALLMAYCQLLSMQHLRGLVLLMDRRQSAERKSTDLGFNLDDTPESLNFDQF